MRATGHRWRRLKDRFKTDCQHRRSTCWQCHQPIDYTAPPQHPNSFEADHYHPTKTHPWLAYEYNNLRPSHSKCNRARGATPHQTTQWVTPTW